LFVQKKEKEDLTKFEGMIFKKDMDYFFKNDLVKIKVDKDNINDEKIPLNTTLVLFFGRIDLIDFSIDPKSLPNLMGNKKKKSNITSIVMKDGYYISDTVKWEDWHAGHKFEGTKYYLIKFLDDNKAIRASNDSNKIPESIFDYRMEYRDSYRLIDNKTLEITINPESEWSTKKKFTILSPKLLLDENLLEYHFVYDPSTDLTEQQKSKS